MEDYIKRSVKFRMGRWYDSPFELKSFDWSQIDKHGYTLRTNLRYKDWIVNWQKKNILMNPGVILDSQDSFFYDDIIKKEQVNFDFDLKTKPIISHNRLSNDFNSILFPLIRPTLRDAINQTKDQYHFSEKKNEVVWRGKFMGKGIDQKTLWYLNESFSDLDNYVRFNAVKIWSKKFDIGFIERYIARFSISNKENFEGFLEMYNLDKNTIVLDDGRVMNLQLMKEFDNFISDNKMIKNFLNFEKEICKNKFILSLDGSDKSSALPNILSSKSVMIGPIPKWHNIFDFELSPWEHYIPLNDDASDLEEMYEWGLSNLKECEKITNRANLYMSKFTKSTENEIQKNIFKRLHKNGK